MDFSELFTESARQVLPAARAKGLVSFLDYRGSNIDLALDGNLMRAAMHRLLLTLTESIDQGFITLNAEAICPGEDRCIVNVTAAGTGVFATDEHLAGVLQRHGVHGIVMSGPDVQLQWQETMATDPPINVALSMRKEQHQGLAITWQAALPARLIEETGLGDAGGTPAWLVSAVPGGLDSVEYRLRRQGWHVTMLQSLKEVQVRLDATPIATQPMLLMVAESAQATLASLAQLARLSPATWQVLAVLNGSPALSARGTTPVDIRALPLSRAEINAITCHVDPRFSSALSRQTSPVPSYRQAMRRVLVADDNAVNQIVARGLLELLGCEVEIAADGQQAIDCCRVRPPDLVLMDVHMPVLDGLKATEQLRALQRHGVLPPFPIVAATAMHAAQGRPACMAAGMDGYLDKPLDVQVLNGELHRVLPMQPLLHNGNPTY